MGAPGNRLRGDCAAWRRARGRQSHLGVEGSNAAEAGCVAVGDVLVGVTGVRYPGSAYLGAAKPERDIFPAHEMNFDQVVEAIGSNEPPECDDVILRLRRAA